MGWKDWPYWLKYGIIAGICVPVIMIFLGFVGEFAGGDTPDTLIETFVVTTIFWIQIILSIPSLLIFFLSVNTCQTAFQGVYFLMRVCTYTTIALPWFIIGSIIGLIVGKVRSKG